MSRVVKIMIAVVIASLVPVFSATSARADSCTWSYGPQGYSSQFCSGVGHEYLGSKISGDATWVPGTPQYNSSLYFSGTLKDKLNDNYCTWIRYTVEGFGTYNRPKVCGAGKTATVNISLVGDQLPVEGTVRLYLCQEGPLGCAAVFYQRTTKP